MNFLKLLLVGCCFFRIICDVFLGFSKFAILVCLGDFGRFWASLANFGEFWAILALRYDPLPPIPAAPVPPPGFSWGDKICFFVVLKAKQKCMAAIGPLRLVRGAGSCGCAVDRLARECLRGKAKARRRSGVEGTQINAETSSVLQAH